jgi:two-component system response regulator TtrR
MSARRVLIVDDEPNIVASLEFLMRHNAFEVRSASSGEEALELAASFRPHVVLLDVMLPQASGFEVCRRLRADPAHAGVRIVMLTARGRADEQDLGRSLGADAYVLSEHGTGAHAAMSAAGPLAYVVDDDESMRTLWQWLMESRGIAARTYATAAAFLEAYRDEGTACLVLDLQLPDMSGLDLQRRLAELGVDIPVVFVTGHGDVPAAVSALKGGAVDFIEKPFDYRLAVRTVERAFERDQENRERRARQAALDARLALLTEREREVMARVVEGRPNKAIAQDLDISVKTVEVHRAKVMEKLGADSVAELVQLMLQRK